MMAFLDKLSRVARALGNKKELFLYFLLGIAKTVVYFGLFALAQGVLQVSSSVAVSIAYSITAVFHFWVSRTVTFKVQHNKHWSQFFRYIVLLVLNYVITLMVVQGSLQITSNPFIGLVVAVGVTSMIGYLMSKFWIFNNLNSRGLPEEL